VLPGSWTPPTLSGRPLPNPAYSGLERSRAFSMDQTIAPAITSTEPASAVASMACLPIGLKTPANHGLNYLRHAIWPTSALRPVRSRS
jgi:hypothetical protein